jgi:hypothetical protein
MKNTLITILQADESYNKSATRWLNKTHPVLWNSILTATSFLPDTAKPKQRVWHILNEVYTIPLCPITGFEVKWFENRYLETANRSAKTTLMNKTGRLKNQTEEAKLKRTSTIREGFKSGKYQPATFTPDQIKSRYNKIKQTCLEKYGVESTLLIPEVRNKQYQTKVSKGQIIPVELRSSRDLYYAAVIKLTKQTWIMHFDKINPNRLTRSSNEYNLDHIYSIQEGFRNSIPPYIIAHWTNLRMLTSTKNSSKGRRCDKTLIELYEDVFNRLTFF